MYALYLKRFFDIVIALALSIPVVIVTFFVGLAILIEDGSPIFYRSIRMGKNGRHFSMLKFRSMYKSAPDIRNDDGSTYNSPNDTRVTKIGHILRQTSIDELPQIYNVLIGDMSFVGPRPSLTTTPYTLYDETRKKRVSVRPGITGYSQAYFRNSIGQNEKFKLDCYYVDNISLPLDIKIIIETVKSVFYKKSIYNS